ncbi:hypothetical protein OROMI_001305 [Orobanche minor]
MLAREAGIDYVELQNLTEFYDDNRASLKPPRDWQGVGWKEDDKNMQPESSSVLVKISEQKGILGPGPAELRFSEAL